uniref:Uncharacterized protein n=1 Tax=Arundo donax TaxID=35708 RepID=A0A0A8ZSN6_ARUDO
MIATNCTLVGKSQIKYSFRLEEMCASIWYRKLNVTIMISRGQGCIPIDRDMARTPRTR